MIMLLISFASPTPTRLKTRLIGSHVEAATPSRPVVRCNPRERHRPRSPGGKESRSARDWRRAPRPPPVPPLAVRSAARAHRRQSSRRRAARQAPATRDAEKRCLRARAEARRNGSHHGNKREAERQRARVPPPSASARPLPHRESPSRANIRRRPSVREPQAAIRCAPGEVQAPSAKMRSASR